MIYPNNFESKIGFDEIRTLLRGRCLSALGADEVGKMCFSSDVTEINRNLATLNEFRSIMNSDLDFPTQNYNDLRESLLRLQIRGTYMSEVDLFNLRNTMSTLTEMVEFLLEESETLNYRSFASETERQVVYKYPLLAKMAKDVELFPRFLIQVDSILNDFGKIRDDASPELQRIRTALSSARRSVSISLRMVVQKAQENGIIDKDINPTYRDGRLVIPIKPAVKRRLRGIIHDESATGKTVFLEPAEVVEANNRIRTLESEEQRAIIMILQAMAEIIRPQIPKMLESLSFVGKIDFIRAKSIVADKMEAIEPILSPTPMIDWGMARHPLLEKSLKKQDRDIVPIDIKLTQENRILLISGPNAGGKSICLKTAALLQYMAQCGMAVPLHKSSKMGVFESIFIDIGDEQSIENDLSTYSSHLLNMKNMMKCCSQRSLILIDEFGGGTEPQIGAAMAQATLDVFLEKATFGVITTHYQNLKYYADSHDGIVNGAMLYDRGEMRPLFQLQIGNPGSSFAIEIARNIGLPASVIESASKLVGDEYIKSDKYLQDIVRDKRYWENKRLAVHQKERTLQQMIETYEKKLASLAQERKTMILEVRDKTELLFKESNAAIENTIRSIREAQAEKEVTRRLRSELEEFKTQVIDAVESSNDNINRKMEQIRQRHVRREERKKQKNLDSAAADRTQKSLISESKKEVFKEGDYVRISGNSAICRVLKITGNNAVVQTDSMKVTISCKRLEFSEAPQESTTDKKINFIGKATRDSMHATTVNFNANIDVRGMNGQEALEAVTYFMEDAIQCGARRLTILHGTGTGYLRKIIRQYLKTIPTVGSYHDEHIQFGGAGITVVEMEY